MRRKLYVGALSLEAIVCVVFSILQTSFLGVYTTAMAFPLEQIGTGLRTLSLSGSGGNVAAIVIYCATSLLPIAALLISRKKRKLLAEDGLLGLMSVALFAVLYIMINPGIISKWSNGAAALPVGKTVLGCMVYSVICGYFVLRIMRLFSDGGTEKFFRYMSVMLSLLNVLFVYWVFGACFSGLLNSITQLKAGNTGNEHLLGASYVFLALQFFADALPYAFNLFIVFAALKLLEEMQVDRYCAQTVAAAGQISRRCTTALVATVLANIGYNLLQLVFAKSLVTINSSVQIPVFSITFVLAALLLTRLVTENKQLKEDNDMFI